MRWQQVHDAFWKRHRFIAYALRFRGGHFNILGDRSCGERNVAAAVSQTQDEITHVVLGPAASFAVLSRGLPRAETGRSFCECVVTSGVEELHQSG